MFERVYLGPAARSEHARVQWTVRALVEHYLAHPDQVPAVRSDADDVQRVIDYVAGMTDRYCIATFRRLALPEESRL
jgi:dGTPase